ncbi:MAG: porin [Betaproteobacteria bacterium]|nr:MAG: porin [Betaproteobacteria bacterium]
MKRRPLAITAMLTTLGALPVSAQIASTELYGQFRLTVNSVTTGDKRVTELRDNASRFGFRGREDLGGGLRALYGAEYGFGADTGALASTTSPFRTSYVGLSGAFGVVALGRLDSSNPTGSPLYSQVIAITSFAPNDAGATATSGTVLNSRNRTSDSVGYLSPNWGGVDFRARVYNRGAGTATEAEDAARSVDLGLNYAGGPLRLALGYGQDTRKGGLKVNEFDDKWQIGARYDMGMIEPYAMYGRDRYNNTATTRGSVDWWVVGAKATQGASTFVLNVMQRDVQSSLTGKQKRWQAAYIYAMSKRTQFQIFIDNDGVNSASRTNVKVRAIGSGIRHDF